MKKIFKKSFPIILSSTLLACSSSDDPEVVMAVMPDVVADTPAPDPDTKTPDPDTKTPDPMKVVVVPKEEPLPVLPVDSSIVFTLSSFTATKAFHFTWEKVPGATSYRIREAVTVNSGYNRTPIFETTDTTATSFDHIVPLYARLNAKYILENCNAAGKCTASRAVFTSTRLTDMASSIGYFKASNTGVGDNFGDSVSISEDGNTLAVGAVGEDSNSQTNQNNGFASAAGAVYVFTRNNTSTAWSQKAYLKATITDANDSFGTSVSISADGNTLAVGATGEDSNGDGADNNAAAASEGNDSGAVYVFTRDGEIWTQVKYLKASNPGRRDEFGTSVSLSADGNTLAVGAPCEDGDTTYNGEGKGDEDNNTVRGAGAVYVFARTVVGTTITWAQQKYLKASNAGTNDNFGFSVSLSADGHILAVGANDENSGSRVINMGHVSDTATNAGAVYVFARTVEENDDITWAQQAYLKANNTDERDKFGYSVSLSADGNTLAVGALNEGGMATGVSINAPQNDNSAYNAGAAYVFIRDVTSTPPEWSQQAYLKASNTGRSDEFGFNVSISADGNTLAVGAQNENSNAVGIHNVGQDNSGAGGSGAVYTFTRSTTTWSAQAYIKASNTGGSDAFGYSLALSGNGGTLAVSSPQEGSIAKDVNGDKDDDSAENAGAVYLY